MQLGELEMGNRPSRQRRHLPLSVTSSVTEKRPSSERNERLSLLKMSFRSESQEEKKTKQSEKVGRRKGLNKEQGKMKRMIRFTLVLWILFILVRLFLSFKQQDFGNLSLVRFMSNIVNKMLNT